MSIEDKTPKGNHLGSGVSSTVYEHPTNDDRVLMFGWFDNDLVKLSRILDVDWCESILMRQSWVTTDFMLRES